MSFIFAYDNVAGRTATLTASSKAGPFISQPRKYSGSLSTIKAGYISATGTYSGSTRSNYQVEITSVSGGQISSAPVPDDDNFGDGFFIKAPDQAIIQLNDGSLYDITSICNGTTSADIDCPTYFPSSGSTLYLGMAFPFDSAVFNVSTANGYTCSFTGRYNAGVGTGFPAVTSFTDHTKSGVKTLNTVGERYMSWDMPSQWAKEQVFGLVSRYWFALRPSAGITGTLSSIYPKQRPTVSGAQTETWVAECDTKASGGAGATFTFTGTVTGDDGDYQTNSDQSAVGGSLTFRIWDNPAKPFKQIRMATTTLDSSVKLKINDNIPIADANTYIASVTDFDFSNTRCQYGHFDRFQSNFAGSCTDTYNVLNIHKSGENAAELWCRKINGGPIVFADDYVDCANNGYRTDYLPGNDPDYFSIDGTTIGYVFSAIANSPMGYYDGKIFYYNHKCQIVSIDITTKGNSAGATDTTGQSLVTDFTGGAGFCHEGQTMYMFGMNNEYSRFWTYNMATDTFSEGTTTGFPIDEVVNNPGLAFDYDNNCVWMHGGVDSITGRKIKKYSVAGDSWYFYTGSASTVDVSESRLMYMPATGATKFYSVTGRTGVMSYDPTSDSWDYSLWTDRNLIGAIDIQPWSSYGGGWFACPISNFFTSVDVYSSSNGPRCNKYIPWINQVYRFRPDPYLGVGTATDLNVSMCYDRTTSKLYSVRSQGGTGLRIDRASIFDGASISVLAMYDTYDGGTWTVGTVVNSTFPVSSGPVSGFKYYDDYSFSGAEDTGDFFTFNIAPTVSFKWTEDYENSGSTWYTDLTVSADETFELSNGAYITFSSSFPSAYNLGDYWRFYGDYNYNPENVYNWNQRKTWRTVAGDCQAWLVLDLGDGNTRACDAIGIFNTNFEPTTTAVAIQANSSNSWSSAGLSVALTVNSDRTVKHFFSNDTAYRYWRLTVNDTNLNYIDIGALLLSETVTMSTGPKQPDGIEYIESVSLNETPYGQRSVKFFSARKTNKHSWEHMDQSDYNKLYDLHRVVKGGKSPFILAVSGETQLVRWTGNLAYSRRTNTTGTNPLYQGIRIDVEEEIG